jgi:FKBP-type peptidyl-prolyl cis-trans isomerase FklB
MKETICRLMSHTLGCGILLAAPLVGAQTPPAPATPGGARTTVGSAGSTPAPATNAAPAPAPAPAPPPLTNEQASYLFGLTLGEQLHNIGATSEVTPDDVARGVKDGLQGKKSPIAERLQLNEFAHAIMLASAARNKSAAQDYLARNGHDKAVHTTASGLEYKVLIPGDAKAAPISATDEVTVNYRGKFLDGTEFDSSYTRGVPATFTVGGVIKGWQEALVMMKPGAKWQLYVPPELAYGANPRPGSGIPPNALLIFDVEVLSVKPKPPAPAAKPASTPPPTSQ